MKVEIVGEGGGSIRDAEMTWVDKKLGELAKICTGKLDANASSENGKYPFFTCARQPLRINSYSYDCECVLVAGNGDLNVKYYEGKFDAYQRTYIIKVRPELRDSLSLRYVYHFLETYLETLRKQSIGGIIKYIKLGNLTKAPIPLPPISEQKRIAKILDTADALRAKRREALAQLDTFLQSTFLDMFGDPVTNPMGWKTGSLEGLCERIIDCPHSTPHYADEKTDFLCVRSSEIQNGNLVLAKARHVSAAVYNKRIARHEPQAGEVVYTREGGRLGLAGMIPQNKKVCLGQRMMLFGGNPKVATNTYIWGFLHCPAIYRKVIAMSGGGAAPRVNIKQLRQLKATIPPLPLQNQFAAIVNSVEQQKSRMKTHLTELDTLFASLQQRAFNGEL